MTAVEANQIEGYQLSPQQQLIYRHEGASGRVTRAVRSAVTVPRRELASRMEAAVADHEILRTRYVRVAGLRTPFQVVDPAGPVSVGECTAGRTVLRAGELTVEHQDTPDGTLLVLALPRLGVDSSSWSTLTDLLLEGERGGTVPVPGTGQALQYADVSGWLSKQLDQPATDPGEASGPSAVAPFIMPASCWDMSAEPVTSSLTIQGPARRRLRDAAGELGVSEAAILLAAWTCLYARYTQTGDCRVLVVTDGRSADGLTHLLGPLERPVPVRLGITLDAPFAEAVRASAAALRIASEIENHVDPCAVGQPGEGGGIGPVLSFRYRSDRWAPASERGRYERSELPGLLHLDCIQGPDRLFLTLAGTGACVAETALVLLAEAVEQILADGLADGSRAVNVLRMVAPREPAAAPHSRHQAVLHRFLEHAERTPGRPALRCADTVLSYRELAQRADATGALLRSHGVRAGDTVAVLAPAAADTLVAMLGTWMAGAAFVPVDPAWPKDRIVAILREATPALILVPSSTADISLPVTTVPMPDRADGPGRPAPAPVSAEGAAYVIFTSGTSGRPKGVVIGHDQLAHYTAAILSQLRLPDGAGFAAVSTLAADLCYTAIFPTLASGGCVQLVGVDSATSAVALAEWFQANPVSAMKVVPSHLSALLAEASDPLALLPGEALVLGGEALPLALHTRLRELAPRLRVYNHYGPTETTIGASCLLLDTAADDRCASVPVGVGLGDNVLTIIDEEGNPLPPWCPGEVLISGPGVGTGYLAELREGRPGFGERGTAGNYRSGDLGRLVPGLGIEIIGRIDDQVKLHGYRVQLSEIEELLNRPPNVAASAVVARMDESGLVSHLDAYLVGHGEGAGVPSVREAQAALSDQLPPALLPTGWQILDRLPLTRNGKLDRQALPPAGPWRTQTGRPRDSTEQRLLALWASVLDVEPVSPEDDFFDLGGHSLRAIKLMSLINNAFGCRLPMSSVFKARTPAAMAALVRDSDAQDSNLVPLRNAKGGPGIFCLHAGGGNTLSYWELARLLPADRRVLGVESWSLHGRPPQQSFTEMAEDYAAGIAVTSEGPPVLIGWCFGGLIAFETAQALRRAGHEVARLIVVDCSFPGAGDTDNQASQETQPLTESTLIGRFQWHYQLELPPHSSQPPTYGQLLRAMQSSGHLPPAAREDELRTLLDAYKFNMTALERHFGKDRPQSPAPDYPVLLIRAESPDEPPDPDRTLGWRSVVGPGLAFASVAADHHSIVRPPAVADLAALIAGSLAS
jgi:amino acid adenylation domain-containing protein